MIALLSILAILLSVLAIFAYGTTIYTPTS